jgi:hypothetical protein
MIINDVKVSISDTPDIYSKGSMSAAYPQALSAGTIAAARSWSGEIDVQR